MPNVRFSVYLSYLLRHRPDDLALNMDIHGWVAVDELIEKINSGGKFHINHSFLDAVVQEDDKGRFRFDSSHKRIKACQGHSIPWVVPELTMAHPPQYLYHGTTQKAYEQIKASGAIMRMKRHAVHMQADESRAWLSAKRWSGQVPVVLKIAASEMADAGFTFGVTENDVWCSEQVPLAFIKSVLELKE